MKTYDIYAKQNGKWQRKGIQGEPTLPEYDGTVIIEKAGVLRLRRLKDTLSNITTHYFESFEAYEGLLYNDYAININAFTVDDVTIYGLSCAFEFIAADETHYQMMVVKSENDGVMHYDALPIDNILDIIPQLKEFEVISTANSTVDEWLLANTEGVSV